MYAPHRLAHCRGCAAGRGDVRQRVQQTRATHYRMVVRGIGGGPSGVSGEPGVAAAPDRRSVMLDAERE